MKSFTHSIKQGGCEKNREVSLFEFAEGPGVITEQWFTGKGCINQDTIIRYYIDGDDKPTVEFNLYMAQGIGYVDRGSRDYSNNGYRERSVGTEPKGAQALNTMRFKRGDEDEIQDLDVWERSGIYDGGNKGKKDASVGGMKEDNNANPLDDLLNKINFDKFKTLKPAEEKGSPCIGDKRDSGECDADVRSDYDGKEDDPAIPWGSRRFGHVSNDGGLYNTFRVPFQKSIYISMISKHDGRYWYNVRGMQNYPIIVGDIELPANAKLMLYKKENVTVQPFEYVILASSTSKYGLLYQLTFNTESKNFFHQEACFRVINDNSRKIQYLSSGTEDLFLSSYYFNGGVFHTDQAGLSFKQDPGRLCAYKFFEDDPVLFSDMFSLIWRCGELLDNDCFKSRQRHCSRKYGNEYCITEKDRNATAAVDEANIESTKPTLVDSYVWTYEW